jgi:hypothetical protein
LYICLYGSLLHIAINAFSNWCHVTKVIVELLHFRLTLWQH